MEKEFVPFKTAKKLRTIGFDESCCAFYEEERVVNKPQMVDDKDQYRMSGWRTCKNSEVPTHYFAVPTFSQAFRWFRDKGYRFNVVNDSTQVDGNYFYDVWFIGKFLFESNYIYKTYEESELACLDKLIEIVENKSE